MMLNVGNSYVKIEEIEAIAPPESAPLKRLVNDARDDNMCIDLTYGKKTKSIIVMKSGRIILSAVTASTLLNKLTKTAEK